MTPVVLTSPGPDDEDDFLAAMQASRSLHRPWLYPPLTPEAYREYLTRLDARKVGFLARRREDGAIVGWLNLSEIVRGGFQSAFLGYGGVAGLSGQGYMTEALELVLREAFGPLKLHRVEVNVQPENAGSIALAKRHGFELEGFSPRYLKIGGRWRDHERWALTVEDWQERPRSLRGARFR
jgi:[ribosomal protein S5]-alanine N-acetyltransferase